MSGSGRWTCQRVAPRSPTLQRPFSPSSGGAPRRAGAPLRAAAPRARAAPRRGCTTAAGAPSPPPPKSLLQRYSAASTARPWLTGFTTCAFKGLLADLLVQLAVEKVEKVDWKRTATFSFYGGWYCGWVQHGLYNVVYRRLFGASTAVFNALRIVAFDALTHVPLVIFPVYYSYNAMILGGPLHGDTAYEGLRKYLDEDLFTINTRYWMLWCPANVLVFTVVPRPLRIAFIAGTSFVWLSMVSFTTLGDNSGPPADAASNRKDD